MDPDFAGDRVEAEMIIVFPAPLIRVCGELERFLTSPNVILRGSQQFLRLSIDVEGRGKPRKRLEWLGIKLIACFCVLAIFIADKHESLP